MSHRDIGDHALAFAPLPVLGRMIRAGETTPTRLVEFFVRRLETVGRALNAVVTVTRDLALAEARQAEAELAAGHDRGPLHGVPYGAKDLLALSGHPTTWGAAPFRDQTFDRDAAAIGRLRDAGAVLVAKLSMVELAGGFGYEQPDASITGPGRCAWDPGSWAGGSSSGSGSAVGAGLVPFAIGTETWGSIHCPSAFNGITGLRPTYGRVSRRGAMALSWTMDKIGPMTRTVADAAVVLAAIAGPDPEDPPTMHGRALDLRPEARRDGFRFGVYRRALASCQPEVAAAFEASLDVLRGIGDLEEIEIPDFPWDEAAATIIVAEGASAFESFLEDGGCAGLTAPEDRVGLHHGLTLPAVDYLRALRVRRIANRALAAAMEPYDAILAPTFPHVAPPVDGAFSTYYDRAERKTLGAAGNLAGLPSITVPNGFGDRGLPTALEFLGRAYDEARLTTLAGLFQQRSDWHTRHP